MFNCFFFLIIYLQIYTSALFITGELLSRNFLSTSEGGVAHASLGHIERGVAYISFKHSKGGFGLHQYQSL